MVAHFASHCSVRHALPGPGGLPIAFGLPGLIGQTRPVLDEITQLSILIDTSQLLGLPLLIYLISKSNYALIPVVFATITAIHFVHIQS